MKPRLVVLFIAIIYWGCGSYSLVKYTPNPMSDIEEAKTCIEHIIKTQPEPYNPEDVKVYDNKFGVTSDFRAGYFINHNPSDISVETKVFYYKNIGELKLIKERKVYRATFLNKDGSMILHVYINNEADAKRFADAVYTLMTIE